VLSCKGTIASVEIPTLTIFWPGLHVLLVAIAISRLHQMDGDSQDGGVKPSGLVVLRIKPRN
jgi:hypothetical protein